MLSKQANHWNPAQHFHGPHPRRCRHCSIHHQRPLHVRHPTSRCIQPTGAVRTARGRFCPLCRFTVYHGGNPILLSPQPMPFYFVKHLRCTKVAICDCAPQWHRCKHPCCWQAPPAFQSTSCIVQIPTIHVVFVTRTNTIPLPLPFLPIRVCLMNVCSSVLLCMSILFDCGDDGGLVLYVCGSRTQF